MKRIAPSLRLTALTAEQRWLDNIALGQPGCSRWTAGLDIDDVRGSVPRLVKALDAQVWSPY
jgi:glycerophosphoryl diester phosphodiesterase